MIPNASAGAASARSTSSPKRPAEPPRLSGGLPFVGHMLDFVNDAIGLLTRAREECGEVATFRVAHRNMVFLTGPKAHEAFYRAPDSQLSPREAYQMMVPVFGKDVVYDATLERMAEQLQILLPALQDRRMRTYGQVIAKETRDLIESWGDEGVFDLYEFTKVLTSFTSSHCLLGPEFRYEMTDEFAKVYADLERGIIPAAYINPYLPIPAFRKRDRARVRLVEMISEITGSRRASGKKGEDFLQTLMDAAYKDGTPLSDHEITGLLLAAMFAGHHTSSVTTAWTLLELLQHPHELKKVRDEIDATFTGGKEVDYASLREIACTERAVKETLRLHPPLFMLLRGALEPFEYGGYTWPAGTWFIVAPAVAHRIPEVFPNPDHFEPDRFGPGREEDKQPFAFIAFGGGRHKCMGNAFAMLQLKTILSILLLRYDFDLLGDPIEADFHGVVIGPKQPIRLRYRRRK